MKLFFIIIIVILILIFIFKYLLKQSKKPSGAIGIVMMRMWNNVYLPMAKWCLSFVEKKEFNNVLDIGIGNGATTKYISETFICKSIIGIDISNKAIEQAMTNNSKDNIVFEVKNINETQYPSNYFELICAFQNHFHWNDLEGSFSEIRRILCSNGIFIIGCEYSKVKYYLSDLKSDKAFDDYLNNLNLKLVQIEHKKDWIFYKIKPK